MGYLVDLLCNIQIDTFWKNDKRQEKGGKILTEHIPYPCAGRKYRFTLHSSPMRHYLLVIKQIAGEEYRSLFTTLHPLFTFLKFFWFQTSIIGEEWWRVVKRQNTSSPYILLNTNHLNIKGEEWRVFPKEVSIPCFFFFSWLFLLHFLLFLLFYPKINCIFASVFKTYCNLSISDIDVSNNI